MASKRSASDAGASGSGDADPTPTKKKRLLTQFEPVKIGPVYSLEEMDVKDLQFQNKKLVERIEQRRRMEDDLRQRIEQLEQRQTTDDAVLVIINRYWNQVCYLFESLIF
jgi:E3 ubiquitin-protein ligase BRE1